MSKEELKELLKENLVLELYETRSYGYDTMKYLNVEIRFDGEVICKDSYAIYD